MEIFVLTFYSKIVFLIVEMPFKQQVAFHGSLLPKLYSFRNPTEVEMCHCTVLRTFQSHPMET